jgi:nucleotide-binding universal stress UspA family protein
VTQLDRGESPGERDEDVQRAKALLEERGIDSEAVTALGDPASSIARLAEERNADLVVIGAIDGAERG